MNRLATVEIDENGLPEATAEIAQERRVAIFDLLEENCFSIDGRGRPVPAGPYGLLIALRDGRLVFDLSTPTGATAAEFHLALGPFRQVVKDYHAICVSYYDALKRFPPSQIETVDMARRGIHDEGARVLSERLEGKATVDPATARRLFTLITVLLRAS